MKELTLDASVALYMYADAEPHLTERTRAELRALAWSNVSAEARIVMRRMVRREQRLEGK